MARLGHKKSRGGCVQCKKRRVKCDEKRPCSACVRLEADCSLLYVAPVKPAASPKPAKRQRKRQPRLGGPQPGFEAQTCDQFDSTDTAVFSLSDAELLHHWTTTACFGIPAHAQVHKRFQEQVPRQALRYPYLMHQIMAVAALHLAHLRPQERNTYANRAFRHQAHALAGLRTGLADVTLENCQSLFLTAALLAVSCCASCVVAPEGSSSLDGLCDIATQLQGLRVLRDVAVQGLTWAIPFPTPMPRAASVNYDVFKVRHIGERLQALKNELETTMCHDEIVQGVVKPAMDILLDCLREAPLRRTVATSEFRGALVWPLQMGDDFVALLKARNEAAMTIVLYYSLILKIAGGDCWLMDGWGFKLSTEVSGLIVNQPWVGFAQWPIAEMGRLMSPSQEVYVEDPWGLD